MKILPVGVEFFHADRQAGVKLPADFINFFATQSKITAHRRELD
jgi:hypothetical protein